MTVSPSATVCCSPSSQITFACQGICKQHGAVAGGEKGMWVDKCYVGHDTRPGYHVGPIEGEIWLNVHTLMLFQIVPP